jgi:cytochrome c oxidase subunit 4
VSVHVVDKRVYYRVFWALMWLLILTVGASWIEHQAAGVIVAITIAVTKAVLIALFFMHLRHTTPMVRVFASAGFIWLLFLLLFLASDLLSRT